MNALTDLSPKTLRRAANLQEKISKLQKEVARLLGIPAEAKTPTANNEPKAKRHVSAAARAKMRKAQKARWAKIRAEKKAQQSA